MATKRQVVGDIFGADVAEPPDVAQPVPVTTAAKQVVTEISNPVEDEDDAVR